MRILTSLVGLVLCCTVAAEGPKFKLVTENFPPFNFSVNGKNFEHSESNIKGLCTELVQGIFKQAGYEYKLKLRQWSYAYNYAQKKANRGVFCTTRTKERETMFKWVGPLATNDWAIFALDSFKGKIKKESDLKAYKIGAYKGDSRADYLKKNGMDVSELSDDRLNPERLEEGMIDLWISSTFTAPKLAKDSGVNNLKHVFTLKETELYLAMNLATEDELVSKLNEELNRLRASGAAAEISKKYQ